MSQNTKSKERMSLSLGDFLSWDIQLKGIKSHSNLQMANTTGKSPLLNCPPEIRNSIYGYVLSFDNPIINDCEPDSTFLALLQVSKSVEREAAPIFYKLNLFRFRCRFWTYRFPNWNLDGCYFPDDDAADKYNDPQRICRIINMPERYINCLRNVELLKVQYDNEQIFDLRSAINFLAARNTIRSLSITLLKNHTGDVSEWHPDPCSILRELDDKKRISTAVGKLTHLRLLEIVKLRDTFKSSKPLRMSDEGKAELFNQVKVEHFTSAKTVLYGLHEEQIPDKPFYLVADEFLIFF